MSALIVKFHSSEAFLLNDERAAQEAEVRGEEYVEGTYAALRTGPT
jgi:hypothetical protein